MTLLQRLGRRHRILLGAAVGLVLLIALFDWNWFRPALERYVSDKSRREVHAADLHVGLDPTLQPVVRLRGVQVQNARWADTTQPFIAAREIRLTFDWATLLSDMRRVRRLVLIDAEVDLERLADGQRNWRLTRPDDTGPGRMQVMSLALENSRVRFRHDGVSLDVAIASRPLAQPDGPHTQQLTFDGRYNGAPFDGQVVSGPVISLQQTGQFFALRGQARSRQTALQLDGRLADLIHLGGLDAQVRLAGPSIAQLAGFFPRQTLPASRPYRLQAQLTRHGDAIGARQMTLKLGDSDLAGEVLYDIRADDRRRSRNLFEATLTSQRLRRADFSPLERAARSGAQPSSDKPDDTDKDGEAAPRLLPRHALPLDQLHRLDAKVTLKVAELSLATDSAWPALRQVQADATLDHGLLAVSLNEAQVAGGRIEARFAIDHRDIDGKPRHAALARLDLQARQLQLDQLWPAMPRDARVQAPLSGQVHLSGHGQSVADWAASAAGQLQLSINGGQLSRELDAKLGLNAGQRVRAFFDKDKPVAIRCGVVAMDFADGKGTTRRWVMDTDSMLLRGRGSLLLGEESWALLLTPEAHGRALLALDQSILARGSFRNASIALAQREDLAGAAGSSCAQSASG